MPTYLTTFQKEEMKKKFIDRLVITVVTIIINIIIIIVGIV